MPEGVEHAHAQRHGRNLDDVGKDDAGELHRQVEQGRIVGKPRGDEPGKRPGEDDGQGGQHPENNKQPDHGRPGHGKGARVAFLFAQPGKNRHEGHGHGAFGEKPAHHVGQAVGYVKGVGGHAGPEHVGQDHVPEKTEDARKQRGAADNGGILGDLSDVLCHNVMGMECGEAVATDGITPKRTFK
jgi:hypothetical protein